MTALNPGNSGKRRDPWVIACALAAISYGFVVIWYVTTFPDIGVRSLLPNEPGETGLLVTEFVHEDSDVSGPILEPNDRILEVGGQPASDFLQFVHNLADLRSPVIPVGGVLAPDSKPIAELRKRARRKEHKQAAASQQQSADSQDKSNVNSGDEGAAAPSKGDGDADASPTGELPEKKSSDQSEGDTGESEVEQGGAVDPSGDSGETGPEDEQPGDEQSDGGRTGGKGEKPEKPASPEKPGSTESAFDEDAVPDLVEIISSQDGQPGRLMVRVDAIRGGKPLAAYVSVKSIAVSDFGLTIIWFLSQLGILAVALTAWWQRPGDEVIRVFCMMCAASIVAFVGGFHWWVIVANPLLNLPFIVCACLLPPTTLHFFCRFPRDNFVVTQGGRVAMGLLYGPPLVAALLIAATYWAGWALMSTEPGEITLIQRITALLSGLLGSGSLQFNASVVAAKLLYVLRILVYFGILVSSIYFGLTVWTLANSLGRTQSPVERRQTSGILIASLLSTLPIAYTLYLAFYQKESFALGQAQWPMFIASGMFMAAYAWGMLKHRLILADETLFRGRQYFMTSGVVTVVTAVALAAGALTTRTYSLPLDASIPLHLSSFLVLVLAIGFLLWVRDRVQAIVDQRFFSEKYQIDRTLRQLNQASGYLADPTALAEVTLVTCRDVMDASTAAMYVRDPRGTLRLIGADDYADVPTSLAMSRVGDADDGEMVVRRIPAASRELQSPVQELMVDLHCELLCFLRSDSGTDGVILVGRKVNGAPYSPEDIAFLQATGQMTVLALHSSRANQNLSRLNSELKVKVDRIAEQQRQLAMLRAELTSLQQAAGTEPIPEVDSGFDRGGIRGNSGAIHSVLEMARKAASSNLTVLVRGESGTGKELLARVVHRNSDRADRPMVSVNCAALAPSLLESELFGHVRGAFTGATSDKEGRFQAADGGTLFLDEIGDISLETQVKLLRVLQERCFEPVGSGRTVDVDVRVIAATHRNLEEMIAVGEFREDLYYRLNVISVTLPALRERREDLIELVFYFLNRGIRKTGKTIRQIEPDALAALEQHRWPGNIRELENAVERAIVLADGDSITLKDLPGEISAGLPSQALILSDAAADMPEWANDLIPSSETAVATELVSPSVSEPSVDERAELIAALESTGGNKARAARSLNLPRSTFYSRLKKHGLG